MDGNLVAILDEAKQARFSSLHNYSWVDLCVLGRKSTGEGMKGIKATRGYREFFWSKGHVRPGGTSKLSRCCPFG